MAGACGTADETVPRPRADAGTDVAMDTAVVIPNVPGGTSTFVVTFFRIGMTTREGVDANDAWKSYGTDLDGLCTTSADSATSKGTCKRPMAAANDSLADGNACIDNNFGARLIPLIKNIDPNAETKIVDGIKKGGPTLVIQIKDLAPDGEDGSAPASLFAARAQTPPAVLDGTEVFDVDETSVDGVLEKPLAKLDGVVTKVNGKRIWRGRADAFGVPAVFIAGATGALPLRGAVVEIDLDEKRGTLAGYTDVREIQTVVNGLLAQRSICPGNLIYEQVSTNVRQAADMPLALPHDPAKECGAMSIGLGLDLVKAELGVVVPTPPPKPDGCAPDAGM